MALQNKRKKSFKIISALMAGIFLWNQIAWAGDLINAALEQQYKDQAQTFAPAYLQNQQSSAESLISQKQDISDAITAQNISLSVNISNSSTVESLDLNGPRGDAGSAIVMQSPVQAQAISEAGSSGEDSAIIKVTTETGDIIRYKGGSIDSIERQDGTIITGIEMYENNELKNALLSYPDGSFVRIVDGRIFCRTIRTGTEYYYDGDGVITSSRDGASVTSYSYIKDGQGSVIETILSDTDKTVYYGNDNKIKKVEFNSGKRIEYDNGIIRRITEASGTAYVYEKGETAGPNGIEYAVSLSLIIDSGINYSIDNNNIAEICFAGKSLSDFQLDGTGGLISGTISYVDGTSVLVEGGRIYRTTSAGGVNTRHVYEKESVQQAIYSALPGDTVYLHSGTYREHIVLLSGINLVGENSGNTIIHGDYQVRVDVIRALGNNRIENLTISGSGAYSGFPSSAIRIEGDNVSIRNNSITDNRDYALHIWSGANIRIEKNLFKDNSLAVQMPNSGTTIQYNTFVNNNIAINILNGPTPVIRNNIITGSTFQSIYEFCWSKYAQGLPSDGYAIVEGNILYNNVERGGYYCKCLPPAVLNQTNGNAKTSPLFINPASQNYSVRESSPAYGKGAFLPQALSDSLDQACGQSVRPAIGNLSDAGFDGPVALPAGGIFDARGRLITTNNFTDMPYFNTVLYGNNKNIKEVRMPDGSVVSSVDDLINGISGIGFSANYSYGLTGSGDINSISVDRGGIKRIYDQYGNLSNISAAGISTFFNNGVVSRIEKEDGTIVEGAIFDTNNNIVSASITNPGGMRAIYSGGVLREARQPDGSDLYYDASGNIEKLVNSKGLTYIYSTSEEDGQIFTVANLENADLMQDAEEIVYQKYDADKNLIEARRKNGSVLGYSYTSNPLAATIVSDGYTITTYDKNNNIVKAEVLPTEQDPVPTFSEYEYDRIRRVYKGETLIYRYSYEFDIDAEEITIIEDIATGDFKRYKDELLVSITDKDGLITAYEYNSGKKIFKSTITYLDKIMNQYNYTYEGDNKIIQDMDGIRRTYNKDDKLTFLEEGGKTYAYTYNTASAAGEETVQELISVEDEDGSVANYEGGVLVSIVKPDGTVLSDLIISADNKAAAYAVLKDGIKYFIENNKIIKEVRQNGVIIKYSTGGLITSFTDTIGEITYYDYEYSASDQVAYILAKKDDLTYRYDKNGLLQQLIDAEENNYFYNNTDQLVNVLNKIGEEFLFNYIDNQGAISLFNQIKYNSLSDMAAFSKNNVVLDGLNNLEIKLYRDYDFDFGNGSDGDLRVEAGQTVVIDGTKNYKSIYVAYGATLTVIPWNGSAGGDLRIKCLGSVVIEGSITVDAKGYRGMSGNQVWSTQYICSARGMQGESFIGSSGCSASANYGAGGGGGFGSFYNSSIIATGAGGSYGTSGANGIGGGRISVPGGAINISVASAGSVYGDPGLSTMYMGSAGGASCQGYAGGCGGGIVKLSAKSIDVKGIISSNGGNGSGNSGGGSGGTVWIEGENINVTGSISVIGGNGGGHGGDGRIRIDYGTFTGNVPTSTPYMVQVPYDSQGLFVSTPIAITATGIGSILSNTNTPAGTAIRFKTRTGASSDVSDGSWSGWVETTNNASEYKINSPVNKYIQYQAIFETADVTKTPSISSIGDYAVKFDYSYNKTFDATAPPDDLLFKEYITFTTPDLPIAPQLDGLKIDSAQFNGLPAEIESRLLPDDVIIQTKSFKDELGRNVALQISRDDKFTYLIDGRINSVHQKYDDGHVELIMEYTYDESGELASVRLPDARDSVDTQVANARLEIAAQRANYLRDLSAQKGLAYTQIRDQVQVVRNQIDAQRSQLQPQLYQEVTKSRWVGWWIFGWWETYRETVEVPGVRDAINQLNEQERELNNEESKAYAQLSSEIAAAEDSLKQDETVALAEVGNQENIFQAEIIKEETVPVILDCYRSILGRDPDDAETNAWLATVSYDSKIDVNALKNVLMNSQERIDQEAFVTGLKNSIKDALYDYIGKDDAEKELALQALGLTSVDTVNLGANDVQSILSLLGKQNIHFGRSAFVSLEALLKEKNIVYNLSNIALKAILIDVFTGSLNKFSEGTLLELSMYSLTKTVALYGLNFCSTKLTFADLKGLSVQWCGYFSWGPIFNAIAHLKNNHFVVVTRIDSQGNVTYVEHNRGKDGYAQTVSKEDFENAWTGYTIVKGPIKSLPISGSSCLPASKILSVETSQHIKGSCLPFLFPLLGMIFGAIAGAATVVVGVIGAIVTGISAILAPIITGIGALVSGVAQFMIGMGAQIFGAIQFVGSSLLGGIGQFGTWLGGVSSTIFGSTGLGGIITSTGFNVTGLGAAIGKTIVTTALSIGISKGLESLGVNSTISGLLSSFVTGGVSGLFNSGFSTLSFITGSLQGLAIQGVNELAPRLGIDPILSNVIGMTAGSLIGAGLNGVEVPMFDSETGLKIGTYLATGTDAIGHVLNTTIKNTVAGELSFYGITKAGELLGVDPRISYLAGIGIRSYLNPGFDLNGNPIDSWTSAMNGLKAGIVSVGLQWAYNENGINPLLSAMTANVIGAAFEAALNRQNIFLNIGTRFGEGIFSMFTLGGYSNDPWGQATYLARILDFSKMVQEQGLVAALEAYATSIFHQQTVNTIVKNGGILDMVTGRSEVFADANGIQRKRLYDSYQKKYYIDINMATNAVIEKKECIGGVDVTTKQEYGRDSSGNLMLKGRTVEEAFSDNQKRVSTFDEKNNLKGMAIFDKDGNAAYRTLPPSGQSSVGLKDGNIYNYILEDVKNNIKFYVENGEMKFTSLDILGSDTTPAPTYVRDPNKTNLENAEALLDSTFDDINLRFSGEELFGKSAWEVAMRSILLTSAKFQVTYGSEASGLLGSLTADENTSFMDYARLRIESLISPNDYYDIATADELAAWMALKSPSSQYGFSLTAIHGMTPHKDGWADNLNGVKVNGQNFVLTANSWNKEGTSDYIKGDGLTEYWQGGDKRRYIIDLVKNDIMTGWQEAQARGIPFDVALHSLGTVAGYEAIRELKSEHPEISIRNVYMMGSPLGFFIQSGKATYDSNAFVNVTNVVNLYNKSDDMNILQSGVLGAASSNPLLRNIINAQFFGSRPVSGELSYLFSNIHDVSTTVSHGAMWKDPRILTIVEKNGIFTN